MRRGHIVSASLLGVTGIALGSVWLLGGATPAPGASQTSLGLPTVGPSGTTQYDKGLYGAKPPSGTTPAISAARAVSVAAAGPASSAGQVPDAHLESVTRTGDPTLQDTLAWVITYHHTRPAEHAPVGLSDASLADMQTSNCDSVTFVSATTGAQLLAMQDCGPTAEGMALINQGKLSPVGTP